MSAVAQINLIRIAIPALWLAWIVSWMLASGWSAPVQKRASPVQQMPDRLVTIIGAICIGFITNRPHPLFDRLYYFNFTTAWILVVLIALGFVICWWARIYLGRLWSGSVTQKEEHRIVDTGPYGLVRHPIYTGILLSFYATAAIKANWLAFIGAALVTLGFYLKARLEERFLSQDLGPEYAAYRKRVPMLLPLIGI